MSSLPAFDNNYVEYDRWFDDNPAVFEAEIRAVKALFPSHGTALEVGAGTGRFTVALGAAHAAEPSHNMALVAKARGAVVSQAVGEALPYVTGAFDCVLLITVLCFVHDEQQVIDECRRVLRSEGHLLLATLDPQSELGLGYESRKAENAFYSGASFRPIGHTISLLQDSGFEVVDLAQTIIGMPYRTPGWDELKKGIGAGAFAVILARNLDA